MEDKQKICDKLLETLQLTRQYEDLQSLIYLRGGHDHESVMALFTSGGTQEINVILENRSRNGSPNTEMTRSRSARSWIIAKNRLE